MDPVINAAIQLGKELQKDSRYQRYQKAQQESDKDREVAKLMVEFESARKMLNLELRNEERDDEKIIELDGQIKEKYQEIMQNKTVQELNASQNDMQMIINYINKIISGSAMGEDPEKIDYIAACSPDSCASCSGC